MDLRVRNRFSHELDPQTKAPLLSLPWELRREIYKLAVGDRVCRFWNDGARQYEFQHHDCPNSEVVKCKRDSFICPWPHYSVDNHIGPAYEEPWKDDGLCRESHHRICRCSLRYTARVLRVCQQVYIEALPFLYEKTQFSFEPEKDDNRQRSVDMDYNGKLGLGEFQKRFLNSSLAGLVPYKLVRRIDLTERSQFNRTTTALAGTLQQMAKRDWNLEWLHLEIVEQGLTDDIAGFCRTDLVRSILRLRRIKTIQMNWCLLRMDLFKPMDQGSAAFHHACERLIAAISRGLSEVTSRPGRRPRRTTSDQKLCADRIRQLMLREGPSPRS